MGDWETSVDNLPCNLFTRIEVSICYEKLIINDDTTQYNQFSPLFLFIFYFLVKQLKISIELS